MELKNYENCPICSQSEYKTIDNLKPMTMVWCPLLNKYKMKCEVCTRAWNLPEGFENGS